MTTGACTVPLVANGTACTDGNACTNGDSCQAGVCVSGTPKLCVAADQCHVVGVCDSTTGQCSNPTVADGATCTDGNACTLADQCVAGICTSGSTKTCPAPDQCHAPGSCQPATGACSNPPLADGTMCNDGLRCSVGDACLAGVCTPNVVLTPSHCEGPACDICSFDPVVGNCVFSTDSCDDLPDAGDRQLCELAYACFVNPANSCVTQGDPLKCWCGTTTDTCPTDNSGSTQANGPCLAQVFAAAKTTDAPTIFQRLVDPAYPLGRAVNLTLCRGSFCPLECSVP